MTSSRKKVFKGRIFNVYTGQKTLPDGRDAYVEEIEHPGAVLIIPFVKSKIVLIRQYRPVVGEYIWELPAGTLEAGETPRDCAKRELAEETGFGARGMRREGLIYTTPGFCNEKIYIFRAECGGSKRLKGDIDELIRVKLLTRREVRALFRAGKIKDSKTIAALSFAGIL
jgi:ADP-ribose pyrophosphatase